MDEIRERFYKDFDTFNEASHEFEEEKINAAEYRKVSTGFGEYLQRENGQMLRIRVPGGRLTIRNLKAIIDSCSYYDVQCVKLTTGQAIQLHDLNPHAGRRLILRLLDAGIITRGAGGDNPNNVTASPLSGVDPDEFFDVQPYAAACDRYILQYTGVEKLPRKFKLGFCSNHSNDTHVTIKDLGFMANEDGTFDVYAAGGMGVKPKVGLLVASHADPAKVLVYLRAMLDVYMENGDYKNRFKSRTRFLQDTMGTDGFLNAFHQRLGQLMADSGPNSNVTPEKEEVRKKGCGRLEPEASPKRIDPSTSADPLGVDPSKSTGQQSAPVGPHRLYVSGFTRPVFCQKQEGLYALPYHPIGGYLSLGKMKELWQIISGWEAVELRLTPEGGLYIINLNADEVRRLIPHIQDGAGSIFETSIACVGRARCVIGAADSQTLLKGCIEAVRKAGLPDGALPPVHISGCISTCGQTQIGQIGFRGARRKRPDGTSYEVYFISLGGSAVPGHEVLAAGTKAIAADRISEFLVEVGRKVAAADTTFDVWYQDHTEEMQELIARYAV